MTLNVIKLEILRTPTILANRPRFPGIVPEIACLSQCPDFPKIVPGNSVKRVCYVALCTCTCMCVHADATDDAFRMWVGDKIASNTSQEERLACALACVYALERSIT